MQQFINGISHYLDRELEQLIVQALRHAVASGTFLGADAVNATDYADALENDTYLLETTTPPDDCNAGKTNSTTWGAVVP